MEPIQDPLLDEIMRRFKEDSKSVTKDMLAGIGMFGLASRLISYLAILIATMLFVFLWTGYYQLSQWYGVGGTIGNLLAIVFLLILSFLFRKKHLALREKYASLFDLFDKLGAK
jgi:hypothetical protein